MLPTRNAVTKHSESLERNPCVGNKLPTLHKLLYFHTRAIFQGQLIFMAGDNRYDYDVFLSHASANKRWVEVLARNLKNQGKRVFFDEWSLVPGGELVDGLYEGLQHSRAGLLVVSPEAANSGWVGREYKNMLNRKANDPDFIIVPVVYGELAEFPFMQELLWVDFRPPIDYRKAFHRMLCGLEGRAPGSEQVFKGALEIPGEDADTPLEESAEDFFDEVFNALDMSSILLLLAQADRASGSVIQGLLERAQERFAESNTFHLTPPFDPRASTDDYFCLLARQCGLGGEGISSVGFESALYARLASGEPLFLLISGFENGSDEGRRLLAGTLRNVTEKHPQDLRVLICGSEKLADLKYAQGTLSMLNHAEVREWPELTPADVQALQAQTSPSEKLPGAEATRVLKASGGHPRLLRYCLEQRHKQGSLNEPTYRDLLAKSPIAFQLFAPFRSNPEVVAKLRTWLGQDELGPSEPYLFDDLLRRLFWRNLLYVCNGKLRWRCEALKSAGRRVLDCAPPASR